MRRAAAFGILLALAGLTAAPALVLGASNLLHDARVTPSSGTTTTDFMLSVEYTGKFVASSVVVDVAGTELAAIRISGTARNGTWRVTTKLPAGTWAVVFRATATQGNVPALAAGVVLVVDDVPTPTPEESLDVTAPEPSATPIVPPEAPTEPTPGVVDAPSDEAAPAASLSPASSPRAVPTGDVQVGGGAGGGSVAGDSPAEGGEAPAPSPASPAAPVGGGADDDPSAAAASPREEPTDAGPPASAIEPDASVTGVLAIGLAAIAGVAVAGAAILLALRRKDIEDEEPAAAAVTAGSGPLTPARSRHLAPRRSAALLLEEDPIIAALGIDAGPARQPRDGQAERAARRRRR